MAYERKEQLARSITLALTTGLFSIVPVVAEGAPVVDHVVTSGTSVEQSGKVTDVTSTVQNNIVNWKDFSVAKDETVRFDQGAQTNNYLNVVTGAKQSEIAGTVEGGKNVYLVNPHGVLVDKGATVNVGNLYVSTTSDKLDTKDYLATGASPLVNTASTAAADVTNMGTIQAKSVTVEGGVVKFLDMADVTAADGVTITANTKAQIGRQATSTSNMGIRRAMATPAGTSLHVVADSIENFTTLTDANGINTTLRNAPSGNYWLKNDIDMSEFTSANPFTPIKTFSGKLDGNYYSIKNLTAKQTDYTLYSGLFSTIEGTSDQKAEIYDLGIRDAEITFDKKNSYAGGLAGMAINAKITNVYVSGGSVQSGTATGGILGYAQDVDMESVYNTADVGNGAGLVSALYGNVNITNAYNAGTAKYGFYRVAVNSKGSSTQATDAHNKL